MFDALSTYAHRWRFEINHSKCGLMRFIRSSSLPASILTIAGVTINWVTSYNYLGVELHSSGSLFRAYHKRMYASANRAASAVTALGMHSGEVTSSSWCTGISSISQTST